jgi:carbon monoxide dehydrogenase subunit G
MDFSGSQKILAPRVQVFEALLNPEVVQSCIPGCEAAEFVDFPTGRELKLTISINIPGFKGTHSVFLQTPEIVPSSRVVLTAEPSGSHGTLRATCTVDLTDAPEGTQLTYNAHVEREGAIAAIPELIIKGATKPALDHFFKSFEKQASALRV